MRQNIPFAILGLVLLVVGLGCLCPIGRVLAGEASPQHPVGDTSLAAQTKPTTRANPAAYKLDLASAFIGIGRKQTYQLIEDQGLRPPRDIRWREGQMTALEDAIGSLQHGRTVKCLVVDTFEIRPNGISLMNSQIFLHNDNANKEVLEKIKITNSDRVESQSLVLTGTLGGERRLR